MQLGRRITILLFLALCLIQSASIMIGLFSLTISTHWRSVNLSPFLIWLEVLVLNLFVSLFITVYLGNKICVWMVDK